MTFPLYYYKGLYVLVIQKGIAWSIIMEYGNFTTRFIRNEELNNMIEIELNEENIKLLFENNKILANIDLTNYNKTQIINYNNRIYFIYNWKDLFDFSNDKLFI